MSTEIQALRASLVEKRDAYTKAIDALDVAIGLGVFPSPQASAASKPRRVWPKKDKPAAVKKRPPAEPPRRQSLAPAGSSASTDAVNARDLAIRALLKKGPASVEALRDALPKEDGQTDEQRVRACSNALTRLRLRKEIKATADGWTLA